MTPDFLEIVYLALDDYGYFCVNLTTFDQRYPVLNINTSSDPGCGKYIWPGLGSDADNNKWLLQKSANFDIKGHVAIHKADGNRVWYLG